MKTKCPSCGYEGTIDDGLIPEEGRTVGCPRCKVSFTVNKDDPERETDTDEGTARGIEVNRREPIPPGGREPRPGRTSADRMVTRIVVLTISFAVVFIIGIVIGRYTHNYTFTNPLKKKEEAPVVLMTPESPPEALPETMEPAPVPEIPSEVPMEEIPQPSGPLILEESFTSDVYLDITEIDWKLNEVTDVTGLQRELNLKDYAQGLVGSTLVGYFIVVDVGKVNSSFEAILPLSLYRYYIQAEADSGDPLRSVIYVGLKEADELSSSLIKGSRIFIEGFIYSCLLSSDYFELGIVNSRIELSR